MRKKSRNKARPKLRLKYGNHRPRKAESQKEAHIRRVCEATHVYLKYFEQVKEMHREYDGLLSEALELSSADLARYGLRKKNNFEKANTAWKSVPMRQYEIERSEKR